MEFATGQIICVVVFNVGFLLLVLLLLCISKFLRKQIDENNEITVDQESHGTNSQISIIRTLSLPSYDNAITCQKVETPPPKYLELFFTTKSSSTALDSI